MKKIIISIFTAIALSGCNDFIDLKPVDFPTEETFYTDVKGLEGAIIGIYDELQSSDQYGSKFRKFGGIMLRMTILVPVVVLPIK